MAEKENKTPELKLPQRRGGALALDPIYTRAGIEWDGTNSGL